VSVAMRFASRHTCTTRPPISIGFSTCFAVRAA